MHMWEKDAHETKHGGTPAASILTIRFFFYLSFVRSPNLWIYNINSLEYSFQAAMLCYCYSNSHFCCTACLHHLHVYGHVKWDSTLTLWAQASLFLAQSHTSMAKSWYKWVRCSTTDKMSQQLIQFVTFWLWSFQICSFNIKIVGYNGECTWWSQ